MSPIRRSVVPGLVVEFDGHGPRSSRLNDSTMLNLALPTAVDQIKRGVVAKRERKPVPKGYWTIWTTVALDLIGFGIIVPILGRYAERFGASGLTVGLLFASYSLAQLLCAPLLGRLSDRIGRKPPIVRN